MKSKRHLDGLCKTALMLTPLALAMSSALGQVLPGGTLDPTTIPKYVTPLVIPPVLYDDQGGDAPLNVEVALRQINQQMLPAPFPKTPLWAYGDPANPATFNQPSFTIEVTKDTQSRITWRNELVRNPNRCYADPANVANNINACKYRQHVLKDQNNRPLVDQTLHWAAPNLDCREGGPRTDCAGASGRPYRGPVPMVTHVHGAHVGPQSDGYPEAWWLPDAGNIPDGYATTGSFYNTTAPTDAGSAVYSYTNDQPSTTLWYHDHSLGITRLNVYAAGAGFWLIREADDGETGLVGGTLPGPAPRLGDDPNGDPTTRAAIREIPIAIQGKSFNADGTLFYPANRAFFEGLGDGQTYDRNASFGVDIPFLPEQTSDISPVWNPEAFFNTLLSNGNPWPQLEVAPERYRFRLLNATNSRFLNLALFVVDPTTGQIDSNQEIAFYQIGAEQSLLPKVTKIWTGCKTWLGQGQDAFDINNPPAPPDSTEQGCPVTTYGSWDADDPDEALLMGPAERADVIVDFTGLATGSVIRMINTAPDAPFGGFPDVPADPDTTGQVMQFVVNGALANPAGDPSTPPAQLRLARPDSAEWTEVAQNAAVTRDLALLEEESALLCVFIDSVTGAITQDTSGAVPPECSPDGSVPFGPKAAVLGVDGRRGGEVRLWDDPISQTVNLGDAEKWQLWNWSADAHPIHLHLVKFRVMSRREIGGAFEGAELSEAGWKDTVIAYPGEVTTVAAKFDLAGLYVWHCHILEHEDNEMMVPYCVDDPATPASECPDALL